MVNRGAPLPPTAIQPLRIAAFPTLVIIVKSIVYRRPYASTSPGLASPVRATSSNFVRSLEASAAVNPSAAAKTRALCRPRGLSGLRQYSDNLRMSTIARAPFGKRTRRHYSPSMRAASIARQAERRADNPPAQKHSRRDATLKLLELDATDKIGARVLLEVLNRMGQDDD